MAMGLLTMSDQELTRLDVVQRALDRRLSQRAAATTLGLSHRQMKRLVARFRSQGASGLVSGKRGRSGNHRLPRTFTDQVVALVRQHYADFGPTLAREKLRARRKIILAKETVRQLQSAAGLWLPRRLQST